MWALTHRQRRSTLGAFVELDGDHEAVGHAFAADVGVADIGDVGLVVADGVVEALGGVVAVELLLPGGVDLGLHLGVDLPRAR
jgi:hypothetical protein